MKFAILVCVMTLTVGTLAASTCPQCITINVSILNLNALNLVSSITGAVNTLVSSLNTSCVITSKFKVFTYNIL